MDHGEPDTLGLRERKKLRTRRTIALAAMRLFAERGYEETTIADIAKAADISPRTFFSYFPSKEDVVFAELDERLAEIRDQLDQRPQGETPLQSIRRGIVELMGALVSEHGDYAPVQVRLVLERPTLQARALQRMHEVQEEVEERIRELCPSIEEIDAVAAAGIAVGGIQAVITHCRRSGYEPADMRAALDRTLTTIERGLASIPALTSPAT